MDSSAAGSGPQVGASATLGFVVAESDTAEAVGSGELPVLGTPRLLAWCEAATCSAVAGSLPQGRTSVGTRVALEHLGASSVGQELVVEASLAYVDGRLLRFTVAASHAGEGTVVATGEVTRVVVDSGRFLARIGHR
jgi:fluoroacetyl-CoA thioesterase